MRALDPRPIWLCTLVFGVALAQAPPGLAQIVETPSAGSHWRVDNSNNSITRLRVDEATGNISRNGFLFVHTTGGSTSTFVGNNAGNTATTGTANTAFGSYALNDNTTGAFNSAVGHSALRYNTTGNSNSAFGTDALHDNTTGYDNSAFGTFALLDNSSGMGNSAVGKEALRFNETGFWNSAVGNAALRHNTTGNYNSAVGKDALRSNTTGHDNSAVGYDALRSNTTGDFNTAFGGVALQSNTIGNLNTAVGNYALRSSNGSGNSALGAEALIFNSAGDGNSAVGYNALELNTTGNYNVAVGLNAGRYQTTGSDNIYLANNGVAAESGQIRIGTDGTHTQAWMAGIFSAPTGAGAAVYVESNGRLHGAPSSGRFKEAVEDMGKASELLARLRPVTFRYKKEYTDGGDTRQYGLIAEEVAEVAPELVVTDATGKPYTVRYNVLAPMLLNEVQKQQRTIREQKQLIDGLSSRLALLEGKRREDTR
jgi:hypothetical protein